MERQSAGSGAPGSSVGVWVGVGAAVGLWVGVADGVRVADGVGSDAAGGDGWLVSATARPIPSARTATTAATMRIIVLLVIFFAGVAVSSVIRILRSLE